MAHRIQFELHAKVADALLRLDESTAHVVVADQPKLDRDAALVGEAEGGSNPGVRHGNHDIGVHRRFQRELAAHGIARLVHGLAEYDAVRTREIHVLEDAARLRLLRRIEPRMDPFRTNDHQFARPTPPTRSCSPTVVTRWSSRRSTATVTASAISCSSCSAASPVRSRSCSGSPRIPPLPTWSWLRRRTAPHRPCRARTSRTRWP